DFLLPCHGLLRLFFHGPPELTDLAPETAGHATATDPLFHLERAELDQANRGGELRLVERRLQPADRTGSADGHRQTENGLRKPFDLRNARTAAAKEYAGAQI